MPVAMQGTITTLLCIMLVIYQHWLFLELDCCFLTSHWTNETVQATKVNPHFLKIKTYLINQQIEISYLCKMPFFPTCIRVLNKMSTNPYACWEEWHFVEVWNFFNYRILGGDRGDILKLELWYVIIAAKIQQMDMFLFHKSQYLLIYKVCFDVQKVRVNFLCLAISVNRALDIGGCKRVSR